MFAKRFFVLFFLIWFAWFPRFYFLNVHTSFSHEIVFCDVGQGDAILVLDGSFQMLLDGGPDASVLSCLYRYLPTGDDTIELVILSHPDADHFSGLTAVFDTFHVDQLWIQSIGKSSVEFYNFYQSVWRAINSSSLQVYAPYFGDYVCVSAHVCVRVLSDFRDFLPVNIYQQYVSFENLSDMLNKFVPLSYDYNNGSIVINLYFDHKLFLLTGDAEDSQELAIVNSGLLTKVDVLKAGHHGSKSSSSPQFLGIALPETVIISCGKNNSYGHPHKQTLSRLESLNSTVFRTDTMGDIIYACFDFGSCSWRFSRPPP